MYLYQNLKTGQVVKFKSVVKADFLTAIKETEKAEVKENIKNTKKKPSKK